MEEQKPVCPLFFMSNSGNLEIKPEIRCLEEGCAWYVVYETPGIKGLQKGCAIKKLSDSVRSIGYQMVTKR